MILNNAQLAKDGVQNRSKKKGCKIAQLTKDKGKCAIKPKKNKKLDKLNIFTRAQEFLTI